jgi:hypothetical protein
MDSPVLVQSKRRGVKGVLFRRDGTMKPLWKGPKQAALLPFAAVYGLFYTMATGIPRKLAGKTFLKSAEPADDPNDYEGHGMSAISVGGIR